MKLAVVFLVCCISASWQQFYYYGPNYYPYRSWIPFLYSSPYFASLYGVPNIRQPHLQQEKVVPQIPLPFGSEESQRHYLDYLQFEKASAGADNFQTGPTDAGRRANSNASSQKETESNKNRQLSPGFLSKLVVVLRAAKTTTSTTYSTSTFVFTSTYQCLVAEVSSYFSSLPACRRKKRLPGLLLQESVIENTDDVSYQFGNFDISPSIVAQLEPTASNREIRETGNADKPAFEISKEIESSLRESNEDGSNIGDSSTTNHVGQVGRPKFDDGRIVAYTTVTSTVISTSLTTRSIDLSDNALTCRPNFINLC